MNQPPIDPLDNFNSCFLTDVADGQIKPQIYNNRRFYTTDNIINEAPAIPKTPWLDYVEMQQKIKILQTEIQNLSSQLTTLPTENLNSNSNPRTFDKTNHLFQQPDSASSALIGQLSLSQALNLILRFDGDPDNLNLFSVSVRRIIKTFGQESEPYIFFALTDRARLASYSSIELTKLNSDKQQDPISINTSEKSIQTNKTNSSHRSSHKTAE